MEILSEMAWRTKVARSHSNGLAKLARRTSKDSQAHTVEIAKADACRCRISDLTDYGPRPYLATLRIFALLTY